MRTTVGLLAACAWLLAGAPPAGAAPGVDGSCLCGDADDNGAVQAADALEIQEKLVGLRPDVTAPGKCEVTPGGGCGLLDALVIARDAAGLDPFTQQVCPVAATAVCSDATSAVIDAGNAASFLAQGPDVLGGLGDFGLANGRIRAVIDAPGLDPASLLGAFPVANVRAYTAGTLVDLASDATGNDQWIQQTQAIAGRRTLATGLAGTADATNATFIDATADFVSDGVAGGDALLITTGANSGLELKVGVVVNAQTLALFVPAGAPYVSDASVVYLVRREISPFANVVVYDSAALLDDQGLPVAAHSGDAVRLRLTGAVLSLDPNDRPTGVVADPATGRLNSGGSPLQVETTFSLLTGSRAIEVETRLTNPADGGIAGVFAVRDVVSIGGLGGANLLPWDGLAGEVAQGLASSYATPFVGLAGRGEPGAGYAMVDAEAGQLVHASDGEYFSVQTQMREPSSLSPGESFSWRRAVAVGEANDTSAVGEAVHRLAAEIARTTPAGTTVPNPYDATATLSGTVTDAPPHARVTAYQLTPALLFDPGPPAGATAAPGFYPSFALGVPEPPIAFVTIAPGTVGFTLTVPSGFPGLVSNDPNDLIVPPGYENGVEDSTYLVVAEAPGSPTLSQIVQVSPGATVTVDFDLAATPTLGRIDLTVTDDLGAPLPARVVIVGADPDGLGPAPATPDPDFGSLPRAAGQANVVHLLDGTGSVTVPPGAYRVLASRGLEYSVDRFPAPGAAVDSVSIAAGQAVSASLSLERLLDSAVLPEGGGPTFESPLRRMVSADLRVHAEASFDAAVPVADRVTSHLASGVEVLISTEHDMLADLGPAIASLDAGTPVSLASLVATQTGVLSTGEVLFTSPSVLELPNSAGSYSAWPLVVDPQAPRRGAPTDEYRQPATLFDELRAAGASVVAIETPRFPIVDLPLPPIGRGFFTNGKAGYPQPNRGFSALLAGGYALPLQTASGLFPTGDGSFADLNLARTPLLTANIDFDLIGIDCGASVLYDVERLDWAAMASAGYVRTATASATSEAHDLVRAAGFPRTFVFAPGNASADLSSLDLGAFNETLLPSLVQPVAGTTTVAESFPALPRAGAGPDAMEVLGSSGPVVYLEVDADEDGVFEAQPGDLVADDGDGSVDVRLTVLAAPWVPVDQAMIFVNGSSVASPLTGLGGSTVDATPFLTATPVDPFSTDLADVVRLRSVLTIPLPVGGLGDHWITAEARGSYLSGSVYEQVVVPGGDSTFTEALGFSNPVFVDADGNAQFDPPGVP